MNTQPPTPLIYALIPKIMEEIGAVSKDRKNQQQGYSFRGIEDCYEAAQPALIKHGVFCAPEVIERDCYRFEKTNDQGRMTTWIHVALKVIHRFYASDGSFVPVTTWGEGLDNSDKATNKAMSGAMKYAMIELFSIPTKAVEDADRASPENGTARRHDVPRIQEDIPIGKPKGRHTSDKAEGEAVANGEVGPPSAKPTGNILPSEDELITVTDQQKLHRRFRESLRNEISPHADQLLHEWLGMKLYLDEHGNPSAKAIRKDEFAKVGKEAVAHAASL